jgi:predicted alpha/beta superfamily hydrolase
MKRFKILFFISVFLMNTSLFGQVVTEPICIGEKIVFKSKVLNQEREILIKLPDNYGDIDLNFPVHYVLDGEIIFNSYSSIADLKSQNEEIPAAIIIGIPNIDRGNDLNPQANGVKFLNFITTELIPFIDNKYRTNKNRVLTGYSMAGNFVIYTLLTGQESFNMYLSGSPYRLDMYKSDLIDSFMNNLNTKKTLYTSIGNNDQAKQLEFFNVFCKQFDEKNNGFVNFKYEIATNRNHDNNFLINWQDGMDYIYKDWKIESK